MPPHRESTHRALPLLTPFIRPHPVSQFRGLYSLATNRSNFHRHWRSAGPVTHHTVPIFLFICEHQKAKEFFVTAMSLPLIILGHPGYYNTTRLFLGPTTAFFRGFRPAGSSALQPRLGHALRRRLPPISTVHLFQKSTKTWQSSLARNVRSSCHPISPTSWP